MRLYLSRLNTAGYARAVRNRYLRSVTCLVLVLQLALGMSVPLSQAARSGASMEHCAAHMDMAVPDAHGSARPHDCCRFAGCQCHVSYTPVLCATQGVTRVADFLFLPSGSATRTSAVRVGEPFRPPII